MSFYLKVKSFKFLFLLLFLSACGSQSGDDIALFNNIFFKKDKTEKICDSSVNNDVLYYSRFENEEIQIPLFKCLYGKNYSVFIGIPYNTDFKAIHDMTSEDKRHETLLSEGDSLSFFFKDFIKDGKYYNEYCRQSRDGLIYLLAVSGDETIVDSLFGSDSFSNRLIKK